MNTEYSSKMPININKSIFTTGTNKNPKILNASYPDSNCNIRNMDNYLLLMYNKENINDYKEVVTYDNKQYKLESMRIYSPSIHLYDGVTTHGEIVLYHISLEDDGILNICVPLVVSANSPELENKTFKNIVEHCYTKLGNAGETVTIHDKVFNAGSFIPKSSFYNYIAGSKSGVEHCRTLLENEGRKGNCSENEEVVVYHKDDGYIAITNDTYKKLNTIIKPTRYDVKKNYYEFNEKITIIEGMSKKKQKFEPSKYTILIVSVSAFSLLILKTVI
mgnify:CR=1 FL=1|tara:strand:- start:904 stop:1731 length:828 start_codon:yes stop_codon:yes gene_type:complete